MTLEEGERLIREAIMKVTAAGWRIRGGCWVDGVTRCCCPIGAVIIAGGGVVSQPYHDAARQCGLSWPDGAFSAFVNGFDAPRLSEFRNEFRALGAKLAMEFPEALS